MRTFGCIGHVKNTKPDLSKLEDRSTKMVFLGYEEGSKAYRLYDPVTGRVIVSRDVVFDEAAAWKWDEEEMAVGEGAHGISGSFVVEQLVITSQVHTPIGVVEVAAAPGAGEAGDGAPAAGEAEPAQSHHDWRHSVSLCSGTGAEDSDDGSNQVCYSTARHHRVRGCLPRRRGGTIPPHGQRSW